MNKNRYKYLHRHLNKRESAGQARETNPPEKNRTGNISKKEQVKDA